MVLGEITYSYFCQCEERKKICFPRKSKWCTMPGCVCVKKQEMCMCTAHSSYTVWVSSVVFVSMNVAERMCASASMCVEACLWSCLCATRRPRGNVYLFLLFSKTELEITVSSQTIVNTWRRCFVLMCLWVLWQTLAKAGMLFHSKSTSTPHHTHTNIHTAKHCNSKGHWNCTLTHLQVQRTCFKRNRKWTVGHGAEWV